MSGRVLHFTLGPVQGFISDARRTRDLWAGSFLLSWLSGKAMAALTEKGGQIIFPDVQQDGLFLAVRDGSSSGNTPYVGSLPNRFKADVANVDEDAGQICKQAVEDAWNDLQQKVWDHFVFPVADKGKGTKDIWDRQVKNFWDMAWVIGAPDGHDGKWLDMRKNWRTAIAPDESGDLCRLMGCFQELSGYSRIGSKGKQEQFWEALSSADGINALDLKDDERLCSLALIKRLFPLIAKDVIGWVPGGENVDVCHWPSVSYVAAVPWLKAAEQKLKNTAQSQFWKDASQNIQDGYMGEFHTKHFNLSTNGFFKLDGHLLHQDGIRAWPDEGLNGNIEKARKALLDGLTDVQKAVGGSASEFYAVLIMDGDQIGARIGAEATVISSGLARFTQLVKAHFDPDTGNPDNGVLIYAGGDDVLAMVPVDNAVAAARSLREAYQQAFTEEGDDPNAPRFTVSAAIVFAQYKIPLRSVLKQAHHYLDDVAKDQNGRDSLAIAVMKPGGISFDWVQKWDGDAINHLVEIAMSEGEYSSSFFYNLRARYAPLFDVGFKVADREEATVMGDTALTKALITAEYKKQFTKDALKSKNVNAAITKMLSIGGAKGSYNFDGVLVARFMSVEGRWDLQSNGKEAQK